VEAIARLLFTDYLFPFEVTSVLLLAAMVGVLLLARRREAEPVISPRVVVPGALGRAVSIGVVGVIVRADPLVIFMSSS